MTVYTGARYWDRSWNPIVGCSAAGPGCARCFAEKLASTRLSRFPEYAGLTQGGRWTGKLRVLGHRMRDPLRWRKPVVIFVALMGDLFHPGLRCEKTEQVLAVMRAARQHTYLLCTKRISRAATILYFDRGLAASKTWVGVSAWDQPSADASLPPLQCLRGVSRWLSLEPLLGPVDVAPWLPPRGFLGQVVVGAETGAGKRRCDDAWVKAIVGQCRGAGVPVFVKQLASGSEPRRWPEDVRVRELAWRSS